MLASGEKKEGESMKSICAFVFAFLGLGYLIPESTLGQSASLIEAAKKEGGKVVVYGSLQGQQHRTNRESLSV